MYRNVGPKRIIGTGMRGPDGELVRHRLLAAVREDPRVAAVRELAAVKDQPDAITVRMSVVPKGLGQPTSVQARV